MSTVFEVPCPECGRQMSLENTGDLECPTCHRRYHPRMGHLFPSGEPATTRTAASQDHSTTSAQS